MILQPVYEFFSPLFHLWSKVRKKGTKFVLHTLNILKIK
jgi:hypothetical protein